MENPALHRLLTGIAAAVVGVIAATFVELGQATLERISIQMTAWILFGIALAAAWRVKGLWATPAIITGGAVAGWAMLS